MGLTVGSVGRKSVDTKLEIRKRSPDDRVIAVAGNPNVGKSTIFNALTGMKQHTGNWPGKTVTNAQGYCTTGKCGCVLVDIPGSYSLMAHSAEEEVARDFICFGDPDAVMVVCDATCLERNLNLVLQILEVTNNVVVCVNLVDEAEKKGIRIDFGRLERRLGVQVIPTVARKKRSLGLLLQALDAIPETEHKHACCVTYPERIEAAIAHITPLVRERIGKRLPARWVSLRLLEGDDGLLKALYDNTGVDFSKDAAIGHAVMEARALCDSAETSVRDEIAKCVVRTAHAIAEDAVIQRANGYSERDLRIDRALTGKRLGYPAMLLMLAGILWLTIAGANVPSQMLSRLLFRGQELLSGFFMYVNAPEWLYGALVLGVYRVLAWVVSVMLPPMAIFFPLFTLLEDAGYLPRVAYNLDCPFRKCCACGKQALTMCMGFGCNAAGVVGCRIIDSPRERLIAILTNSLVPCNGRFPTLIALITMFFAISTGGILDSIWAALLLTLVILMCILMTFLMSKLLSATVLKGMPSSFTLELPPYRRPQIGSVIVRSIFDRTLFVLGRAAAVAAPAGLIIWMTANITIGDVSLLNRMAAFFDPFARLIGLDGVLLMAFVLGFPANEIVMPIAVMAYLSQGSLQEMASAAEMKQIFIANGWTWVTALCTMIFSLFHWPCSTTLMTIRKETGSWKWTAVAFMLPTITGMLLCFIIASFAGLL